MNYRHAYHAGNHADALKHVALLFCLDALARKAAPYAVLDTHAGRGLYDLAGPEAERSPEWTQGIGALWARTGAPAAVARYLAAVRAFNADGLLRTYPGSPALIAACLRPGDVLSACELHPEEHPALRRAMPRIGAIQLHARDGWEALGALLPPPQRRGLVLVDPPYEAPGEMARAARAIGAALQRFGHGTYLWWRPLKQESEAAAADAELRQGGAKKLLRADLRVAPQDATGGLSASSLVAVNPPFGLAAMLAEALPYLAHAFGGAAGSWRVQVEA